MRQSSAPAPVEESDSRDPERYRHELTGFCYRMLGSVFEADDAVQDTMLRAWRSMDSFDGRASLRSWLYRIATNVCIDALNGRNRRALPMDFGPASPPVPASLGDALPEYSWIGPIPDHRVLVAASDPADQAVTRESIRLAFVAALQHLPPRQRAVLILRDVLSWKASEVAGLLETTLASVNSALQRARATLADLDPVDTRRTEPMTDTSRGLLERYVDTFERYDIEAFVALLHEEAVQSMPPYAIWLQGPEDIGTWMLGPGIGCRDGRMVPVAANGQPGFATYRRIGQGYEPFSIQVLELAGGRVTSITVFLDTASLFPLFGLPLTLDAQSTMSDGQALDGHDLLPRRPAGCGRSAG
ncbi:MAG: sigma-70 family RNA polymerase sigma factor [Actinomycetota bacterium]|nr:sigma-70 family RNA polymerase sigma factor [Actinomycetota bacterium]